MVLTAQSIRVPDGRTVMFAEWGDPDGAPVFALHGTPGCRLNRHPNEELVRSTGARVITYDRPGYGGSDRLAGRRVADCVGDVLAIADSLGLERFAVGGGSGEARTRWRSQPWRRTGCRGRSVTPGVLPTMPSARHGLRAWIRPTWKSLAGRSRARIGW